MCTGSRLGLECRFHNPRNACLVVTWLAPSSRRDLPHRTNSLLGDALAPKRDGAALHLQVRGDFEVGFSTAGPESNLCSEDNLLRG